MFMFIEAIVRAIEALMYPRRRKGDEETPNGDDQPFGPHASVRGCS